MTAHSPTHKGPIAHSPAARPEPRPAARPHAAAPAKGHAHPAAKGKSHLPMILGGLAVAGAIAVYALMGGGQKQPSPTDQLLEQIHQAAAGTVMSPHVLGGNLSVEQSGGRVNVTVEGLPNAACVQIGWQLAREGTVIINGVLPQRISGGKLSELCSLEQAGATLVWAPEK